MIKNWKRIDKQRRNEKLVKFAREHPEYTNKALGGIFHISPSRISRILKKYRGSNIIKGQAGESLSIGDACYLKPNGKYYKAEAE